MRILYLVDSFPDAPTDGLKLRVLNILKSLSEGHDVGLVCLESNGVRPIPGARRVFGLAGALGRKSVTSIPRRYPAAFYAIKWDKVINQLVAILTEFRPDVIDCESAVLGYVLCRWRPDVPVVNSFPDCNSLYHRLRFETSTSFKIKLTELIQWRKFINFERDCYKHFDHNVVVGERDRQELLRVCGPIPVSVIQNGVDCDFFNGDVQSHDSATIVFVGVMNYPPNVDAVTHFAHEVLPLIRQQVPEARFIIAGKHPSTSVIRLGRLPAVSVMGYVEDIREVYKKATVVVVPIRFGTGIKNKVLEAMAMAKPVVATTEAIENMSTVQGENVIIADDASSMAREVIALLRDPGLRARIGQSARRHVQECYSWAVVGRKLLAVYRDVVRQHGNTGVS